MSKHFARIELWVRGPLYGVLVGMALTGIAVFLGKNVQALAQIKDWDGVLRTTHGSLAWLFLVVFGILIPIHIRKAWYLGVNRASGVIFILMLVVMFLSGLCLLYSGDETLRGIASWVHFLGGMGVLALTVIHPYLGRRWWGSTPK